MNCAMPCAPAGLTSAARNLLSCQSSRTKNPIGMFCSSAADLTASQIGCGDADSSSTEASACAAASTAVALSSAFVVSDASECSTDAVTVPVWEFAVMAGSDCASATTKDGSVHIDLMSELSKSTATTNTAIMAAKRYRIKLPSMGEKARQLKAGCGNFANELRQSRVFWPVVLPC